MSTICDAIHNRNLISFSYDGFTRVVEPHTYGTNKKGLAALRAYQVRGGSESGEYVGWKIFLADDMHRVSVLTETFAKPRDKYTKGDSAFSTIRCEL